MDFRIITDRDGKFLDLVELKSISRITRYDCLDRVVRYENDVLKVGPKKEQVIVSTIDALREYIKLFLETALNILALDNQCLCAMEYTAFCIPVDFSIGDPEKELIIDQVITDLLYDKYLAEAEWQTSSQYSEELESFLEKKIGQNHPDIRKSVQTSRSHFYKMLKSSQVGEGTDRLGLKWEVYANWFSPEKMAYKKKPKYIWNRFYYNRQMITYRQFRRTLTRDNRNYPYEAAIEDLKEYNAFVTARLPVELEEYRKYFTMMMEYYDIESYKKVDTLWKIAGLLSGVKIEDITNAGFLVKPFTVEVCFPRVINDALAFQKRIVPYRPLLLLEEKILQDGIKAGTIELSKVGQTLQKCQIIRAKTYELLKFHIDCQLEDYVEIKRFLTESYDLISYRHRNGILGSFPDKKWKNLTPDERRPIKERINMFLELNNLCFPPSDKRKMND